MRFKKGSKEAKAFMAKLRAAKGSAKKVGVINKLQLKQNEQAVLIESDPTKNYDVYALYVNGEYDKKIKSAKGGFKKATTKKVGSTLKLTPKETRLGATDKDFKKQSKSYHKDTKSHNVNIRVVSGINGIIINDIKSKYDILTKWNKVLENLNIELKNETNKGYKAAIKVDIFRVKNIIKDIKKDISSSQRKVK